LPRTVYACVRPCVRAWPPLFLTLKNARNSLKQMVWALLMAPLWGPCWPGCDEAGNQSTNPSTLYLTFSWLFFGVYWFSWFVLVFLGFPIERKFLISPFGGPPGVRSAPSAGLLFSGPYAQTLILVNLTVVEIISFLFITRNHVGISGPY
jgi:hypothetical protein